MWEAQALGAIKGGLPAIGFALFGPSGSAAGAAIASTIHVDAKTGKRDYQTTDQTFISASVAAALGNMNSGVLQNLVSAASAGMEYDASGKFTGRINAGNAAIAYAGDYAGGQFNAAHLSQYLARDITTQVLTAGKEYYNYSQGYENGYAAFANPDLTRLGSLAGGLGMSMQKDSREARAQRIQKEGKENNKTDAEIEADLKLAGLDDVLNEIKARINQKANQTDQTTRMAQILQGFGVFRDQNSADGSVEGPIPDAASFTWDTLNTVADHVWDGVLNLGKFAVGAALFLPAQVGIVILGAALSTVGHTLGLGMQIGQSAGMGAGHAAAIGGLSAARIATTLAKYALGVPLGLLLGVPSVIADAFDGRYGSDAENNPNAVTRFGNTVMDAYMGFFGGIESSIDGAIGATYDSMLSSVAEPWTHAQERAEIDRAQWEIGNKMFLLMRQDPQELQKYMESKGFELTGGESETGMLSFERGWFNSERYEVFPDGTVNHVADVGLGFFGLDRSYLNGERLNDGDVMFRGLDNGLSRIAGDAYRDMQQKLTDIREMDPSRSYIATQNGVWNYAKGALDLNNSARLANAAGMANYGGAMTVYNSTSWTGDLGNLGISYALQAAGLPGSESAFATWNAIFESGLMKDGGLIVAHSQGAQIVTHALQYWHAKNETENLLQADLLTLGGAHTIKPVGVVKTMYDARNRIDFITSVFHATGDLINGRPQNSERYQYLPGQTVQGSDVSNHTAAGSYNWAWDSYRKKKDELR